MPPASLEDYEHLLEDRPRKFSPAEVGFQKDKTGLYPCLSCVHFYIGMAMEHNVCEIMRPEDEQIPWDFTCQFHTMDGKTFPKMEK